MGFSLNPSPGFNDRLFTRPQHTTIFSTWKPFLSFLTIYDLFSRDAIHSFKNQCFHGYRFDDYRWVGFTCLRSEYRSVQR